MKYRSREGVAAGVLDRQVHRNDRLSRRPAGRPLEKDLREVVAPDVGHRVALVDDHDELDPRQFMQRRTASALGGEEHAETRDGCQRHAALANRRRHDAFAHDVRSSSRGWLESTSRRDAHRTD